MLMRRQPMGGLEKVSAPTQHAALVCDQGWLIGSGRAETRTGNGIFAALPVPREKQGQGPRLRCFGRGLSSARAKGVCVRGSISEQSHGKVASIRLAMPRSELPPLGHGRV